MLLHGGTVKCSEHLSPTVHKFSRNPPNSRWQKGYMKQVSYKGPKILQWSVSLTVFHCFLFGACKLIHIFVCKEIRAIAIILKIVGTSVQSLVTWATEFVGFVQHWLSFKLTEFVENFSVHKNTKHKIVIIFNSAGILGVLCSKNNKSVSLKGYTLTEWILRFSRTLSNKFFWTIKFTIT